MFLATFGIFIIFSLVFGFFSAAIIYHLKQYTLPKNPAPKIVVSSFLFLAGIFWLFALTFLFKIP